MCFKNTLYATSSLKSFFHIWLALTANQLLQVHTISPPLFRKCPLVPSVVVFQLFWHISLLWRYILYYRVPRLKRKILAPAWHKKLTYLTVLLPRCEQPLGFEKVAHWQPRTIKSSGQITHPKGKTEMFISLIDVQESIINRLLTFSRW